MATAIGLCVRCKKGKSCRLRQRGTWVTECNLFAERPRSCVPGCPKKLQAAARATRESRTETETKAFATINPRKIEP